MRQFKLGSVVLITLILVGCGGGGSDVPAKPKFTAQVSFGDSLSDVGSYRVSTLGSPTADVGEFTINAASGVATNWTELTAPKFGLVEPCAAENGGFGVATSSKAGCFGYAQGGARVTDPAGVGNTGSTSGVFNGAMTVPVVTQIANHLLAAVGNMFTGNEIVFVMAGANDVFVQAALVGGGLSPASGVAAVQTAASQLAADVNSQILAKGAKYVVVVNVPDIASTPQVALLNPTAAGLFTTLVTTFNATLKAGLPDSANVLNVDAYSASHDEVTNPGKYNLSIVATPACNLANPPNPLASSLICNATNLNPGVLPTDHYLFADTVHPTPYGHSLFALYVLQAMTNKGWY
jgi:outer membrane lipase/esterase